MHSEISERFSSRVRFNEPMSKHTTFRVGGPADVFIDVESGEELRWLIDCAGRSRLALRVLGGGSNLLVSEGGVRGIVVRLAGEFRAVRFDKAAGALSVGAGLPLAGLVDETIRLGFNNFCWAAGVPGTVGGAVVGNAGAWGQSIGRFVEYVECMTPGGEGRTFSKTEMQFAYRLANLPVAGAVVTRVGVRLENVEAPESDPRLLTGDYIDRKRRTQPLEFPSAGSVFKNPSPEAAAGVLIDRAGCKGLRVEGAVVSPKHANFIVNDRGATATDVLQLIELVRGRVKEQFGVELELELKVWG